MTWEKVFEEYRGKKVKVCLKNGFRFSGEFLEITEEYIVIDDQFDGVMEIDKSSISSISEWSEDRRKYNRFPESYYRRNQ